MTMDLEQYKKVWEKQPEESRDISTLEIYKMSQSNSSSIVKWIFIIGILEFGFWLFINSLAINNGMLEPFKDLNLMSYLNYANYFHYAVIVLFLVIFYKNYSSISVIDDTKTLMKKIIKTRRSVKWYVYYNLISIVVSTIVFNILIFNTPNALESLYHINEMEQGLSNTQTILIVILSQGFVLILMLLFLWLFYYLLYGLLLKKLNKNYKELIRLEGQ